jgi:hypothetical protein
MISILLAVVDEPKGAGPLKVRKEGNRTPVYIRQTFGILMKNRRA